MGELFDNLVDDRRPHRELSLPFNVWLVQQVRSREQRVGRYRATGRTNGVPEVYHTQKMPPDLARRCLRHIGLPKGATVLDPCAGSGTTLVEAMELGYRGIGCDVEDRFIQLLAIPNLESACARLGLSTAEGSPGSRPSYEVRLGDCRRLGWLADASADMLVTSPPYGSSDPNVDSGGEALADRGDNGWMQRLKASGHVRAVSLSDDNLGLRKMGSADDSATFNHALVAALVEWRRVIKPGGFALVCVREFWDDTGMVDLPGVVMRLAKDAGWLLHDRVYALEASMDAYGALTSRSSAHRHLRARTELDGRACPKGIPAVTSVCVLQRRPPESRRVRREQPSVEPDAGPVGSNQPGAQAPPRSGGACGQEPAAGAGPSADRPAER